MFYAPTLFKILGFGDDASLMSAVISGGVNVVVTLVSVFTIDKFRRRILFLEDGTQMFIFQVIIGIMIATMFGLTRQGSFTKGEADILLFFNCAYVAAFAWS
ncbi:unnamed protein product [Lathyrus sativus]|nr:unnamed protein product [Lathyrus sativus]